MSHTTRILIPIALFCLALSAYSQDTLNAGSHVYGLDPLLYNGKLYTYYPPPGTGGNQYFSGSFYPSGSIVIKNKSFDNLRLNYDLYHQQLILFYKCFDGSSKTIIVSDAWLNAFTLGASRFVLLPGADSSKIIYQEIGQGPKRLLYAWRKDWIQEPSIGSYAFIFTMAEKDPFLYYDHKLFAFKNNHSFIKLFSTIQQPLIKKYLRQNKIRVKKADDSKMTQLMEFINTLSTQ